MTAAEAPALPREDLADLEREILISPSREQHVVARQPRFLSVLKPIVVGISQRGEPDGEERSCGGNVPERTHVQHEVLLLDMSEETWHRECESANVHVFVAASEPELKLLDARPMAFALEAFERTDEQIPIADRPAFGCLELRMSVELGQKANLDEWAPFGTYRVRAIGCADDCGGVHNDHPELDLIGNGFVGIGWDDIGDLTSIGSDKEALKDRISEIRPDTKPGAIPVWAGVLLRFRFEMQVGDLVVYPYKPDSTLNFGRIEATTTTTTPRHRCTAIGGRSAG